MVKGVQPCPAFDSALAKHFNEHQAGIMELPPIEALEFYATIAHDWEAIRDDVTARMTEAQARLFPPKVLERKDNVIFANFRR
jgi:hypothetical protein